MTHPPISTVNRLFVGSPLRRRRSALITISVLLAALTFATVQILGILANLRSDAVPVFGVALVASALLSIVPIAIVGFLDRRERESPWAIATALLWGGIIATGLSAPMNGQIIGAIADWLTDNPAIQEILGDNATLLIGAPIAGPLVEETIKGIGILALLIFLNAEFDNMRDGFIYGALVGIGFNGLESALYLAQNYAEYGFAPWGLQLGGRFALFGLGGHALYSGILGLFLGVTLQTTRQWIRIGAPIVGWGLAVLAHAINNALGLAVALAGNAVGVPPSNAGAPPNLGFFQFWVQKSIFDFVVFLPFILLVLVLLWRSGRWERQVIREELLEEVGNTVTPTEYERIRQDKPFHNRHIGSANQRMARQLVIAQNELAFRKRRVRLQNEPLATDSLATDPLVQGWRMEVARLRSILPEGDPLS